MTPAPASLCPVHPSAEAVATCRRCGRFLCPACLRSSTPPLCANCFTRFTDPIGALSSPFGLGPALRNGFRMMLPVLGAVALLTFLFSIPGGWLSWFVAQRAADESVRSTWNEVRLSSFYDTLIGIICTVACLAMFIGVAEGKRLTLGEALRESTSRYGRVFGARFRSGLWIGLLTLLLILPGIWKAVMLGFVVEASVRLRHDDALAYSTSLVAGRWWEVFLAIIAMWTVAYLPPTIITFAIEYATSLAEIADDSIAELAVSVFENWISRFTDQFVGACSLAMFYGLVAAGGHELEPMHWRDNAE